MNELLWNFNWAMQNQIHFVVMAFIILPVGSMGAYLLNHGLDEMAGLQ